MPWEEKKKEHNEDQKWLTGICNFKQGDREDFIKKVIFEQTQIREGANPVDIRR